MTSSKPLLLALFLCVLTLLTACGGGGGGGSDSAPAPAPAPAPPPPQGNNLVRITVNGSLCSRNYLNKPCVTVTICSPDNSVCQTINDIVLDTASFGLRVFAQVVSVPLTPVAVGSGSLAECIQFGDGSSQWGPVQIASVILGNQPAVQVPIHFVDATFASLPPACSGAEASPDAAGFNGILGVGVFREDCGAVCATSATTRYYSCDSAGNCTTTAVPRTSQVQNPVALLPNDNNGVIVQLPAVPATGAVSVEGQMVIGIGTQANNAPTASATFAADSVGNILTTFSGNSQLQGFFDTGSNGLFFPRTSRSQLPDCAAPNSLWFCPASTIDFAADNRAATGSPSGSVPFQIGNLLALTSSPNNVFPDIGGNQPGVFDWGLPFHLGRNVHFGIEGTKSSLGTGPYFAY